MNLTTHNPRHRAAAQQKVFIIELPFFGTGWLRKHSRRLPAGIMKMNPMTVTLNLSPTVESIYLAEAEARGLALETVIEETLLAARQPATQDRSVSPDDWMRRFKEWSESPAHANLPVLSDHAISRESIYEDRGL